MSFTIERISETDRIAVIGIFNHYILNSFAAYREETVENTKFDEILDNDTHYPVAVLRDAKGQTVGFGMLSPHKPVPTFSHCANILYFIHPDFTGKGGGRLLLEYLENEGHARGITTIMANVSSRNEPSLMFHQRNGFRECGRFAGVGKKHDVYFDTVWFQKNI